MKTLSWGLLDCTRLMAAAFTLGRLSRMEPELSITMPMATGMSSRRKEMIFCGLPSSRTVKSPLVRLGDQAIVLVHHGGVQRDLVHFLLEDENVALLLLRSFAGLAGVGGRSGLRRLLVGRRILRGGRLVLGRWRGNLRLLRRRLAGSRRSLRIAWSGLRLLGRRILGDQNQCPASHTSADQEQERALFRGCIVSGFGVNVQRRQTLGRIQLHLDLPPLAIACWIGWTVSEHILVAQLDANLGGHVRQFVG